MSKVKKKLDVMLRDVNMKIKNRYLISTFRNSVFHCFFYISNIVQLNIEYFTFCVKSLYLPPFEFCN